MKLQFGPWLPDVPALGAGGMTDAKNVVPALKGYRPFRAINPFSNALTARCQGAWAIKDNSGTVHVYAGDATKLYLLSSATWSDATRLAGGAYACPAENQWRFAKHGALGLAVTGADAPQQITLSSGANWAALGGSPPTAKFITVVREFVVMANITSAQNRIQWSGSNSPETWTVGTLESNTHDIPDGGPILNIVGGEVGYIFQARQITRMIRVPAPITFQFDTVEQSRGLLAAYAMTVVGGMIFYLCADGFYVFDGAQSKPIGENQIDLTFLNEVNSGYYDRISIAVDPVSKVVMVAYPTGGGGLNNKILFWHWPDNRYSYAVQDCEILYNHYSLGIGLDSITGTLEGQTLSFDSAAYQGGNLSVGAFDSSHRLSFFDGLTLEATMVTSEGQLNENGRAQVQNVIPLIDTSSATIAMGTRERQGDAVVYGQAVSQRANGRCPVRSTGQYHRAKMVVPAGATWSYAQGVDVPRDAIAGAGRR